MLSDERVCVCVSAPRARIYVFIRTRMCVPRVQICVFTCTHMCVSIGHLFVFAVNTRRFSDERMCVLQVHIYVCV